MDNDFSTRKGQIISYFINHGDGDFDSKMCLLLSLLSLLS